MAKYKVYSNGAWYDACTNNIRLKGVGEDGFGVWALLQQWATRIRINNEWVPLICEPDTINCGTTFQALGSYTTQKNVIVGTTSGDVEIVYQYYVPSGQNYQITISVSYEGSPFETVFNSGVLAGVGGYVTGGVNYLYTHNIVDYITVKIQKDYLYF